MEPPYDVIVVGAGGSGLAAGYSAAERGARVLLLEKCPQPGGTTGIAVGSFTAAGTRLQREAGIQDSADDHAQDVALFAEPEIEARNNEALRRFFLREAAATLEWIEQLGLSFVGPSPEPPNRVPRMHNVVPGAKAYIASLQMGLQSRGATLICNATVESLIREGERVAGVRARIGTRHQQWAARCGVVLAAGDYANNAELIAAHKGPQYQQIEGINPLASGEGHLLAAQAGGQLLNMDVTYGPELRFIPANPRPFQQWLPVAGLRAQVLGAIARRLPRWVIHALVRRLLVTWQHPENSLFDDGAILLNQRGQRFVNERQWPDREIALAAQPDKIAYILLDQRLVARYSRWPHFISTAPDIAYAYLNDYRRLRPDVTIVASCFADVARKRRLPPAMLEQAVAEFNAYVGGSSADAFGRRDDAHQLRDGPCVLLGPVKAYFTTTEGGVSVNQQLQVLDAQGQVIPGLYAVGQNGLGGMILWGHGLHIAWAMTSGRLAGQSIMEQP